MKKETIVNEFNDTFEALTKGIEQFEAANYNQVPFEGSWTAGQVVQHLIMANTGFAAILNAKVTDTEREIDLLLPRLRADFLNFETKMKSPDFILPELKDYDRQEQLLKIKEMTALINKEIATLDLSKTCLAFELPVYGFMTRLEAIYFVIYHVQRHTQQLNRIYKALKCPEPTT